MFEFLKFLGEIWRENSQRKRRSGIFRAAALSDVLRLENMESPPRTPKNCLQKFLLIMQQFIIAHQLSIFHLFLNAHFSASTVDIHQSSLTQET